MISNILKSLSVGKFVWTEFSYQIGEEPEPKSTKEITSEYNRIQTLYIT